MITAGCSAEDKLFKPRLADSHYDAASTHVAVLAVAPWNDIVDKLQPSFSLTADQALNKSLPTTQEGTFQLLEAFNGSLQVALPSLSDTRTETTTRSQPASGPTTETRDVKEQASSGPGTLPALGDDPTGGRKAKDLPAIQLDPTKLGNEALLQYQTATALYQEVQILNNYVHYAVHRTGFTPYLVRLQVAVLPIARNEPYDTFADISFLPPGDGTGGITPQFKVPNKPEIKIPFVIPLLVTDDVEVSLQSRAAEIVRQLRGALSGQAYNVSVAGTAGQTKDEIATALGNDLNAVSTVARLNDNTARVRLGALNQATNRFGMVPRANTVTLLVLVPNTDAATSPTFVDVPIAMRTRLRDATTGELLRDTTEQERSLQDRQMAQVAQRYGIEGSFSKSQCGGGANSNGRQSASDFIRYLSNQVTTGKYLNFRQCASEFARIKESDLYSALWADIGTFSAGYGYSTTNMEIKSADPVRLPSERTLALLLDDTKQQAIALLAGGSGFSGEQAEATLVRGPDGARILPAASVDRSSAGLRIVFPSPSLWQQTVKAKDGKASELPASSVLQIHVPAKVRQPDGGGTDVTCVEPTPGKNEKPCVASYPIAYLAKPADLEAGFTVKTSVQTVAIEDKGQGTYTFNLKTGDARAKVVLTGDGVVIVKVNDAPLGKLDLAWTLTGSGNVTVAFAQLMPEQSFKLRLTDANGLSREIPLTAKALTAADTKKQGAS